MVHRGVPEFIQMLGYDGEKRGDLGEVEAHKNPPLRCERWGTQFVAASGRLKEVGAEAFGSALERNENHIFFDLEDFSGSEADVAHLVAGLKRGLRGGSLAMVRGLVGTVQGFDGFYLLLRGRFGHWQRYGLRRFAAEQFKMRGWHAVAVLLGAVVATQAGLSLLIAEIGADDAGAAVRSFGVMHHLCKVLLIAAGAVDQGLQQGFKLLRGGVGVGVELVSGGGAADKAGFAQEVVDDFQTALTDLFDRFDVGADLILDDVRFYLGVRCADHCLPGDVLVDRLQLQSFRIATREKVALDAFVFQPVQQDGVGIVAIAPSAAGFLVVGF